MLRTLLLPGIPATPETREIDTFLNKIYKIHNVCFIIYLPLILTVMCFSCFWAYKQSMAIHYTDVTDDWEACLTQTHYTVPLTSYLSLNQEASQECVFNQFLVVENTTCTTTDIPCLTQVQENCLSGAAFENNVKIPVGQLLSALSYNGIQTTIFSLASHAMLNRALRHPAWLASTVAFIAWSIWAMLTYYMAAPILPVPSQTNSTLVILMYYAKQYVFENENNGDNVCDDAFKYIWITIALSLAVVLINCVLLVLGVMGEYARRHAPMRKKYAPLEGTVAPLVMVYLCAVFYVIQVMGKMYSSWTTINSIRAFDTSMDSAAAQGLSVWFDDSFFPFQAGSLDINTICWVGAFMSVIRGYTRQSVSSFRLSAVLGFSFILTAFPGLIGGLQFYNDNEFSDYDKCRDYFLTAPQNSAFGYPSEDHAGDYCNSFRLSLAGYLGLFVCMNAVMVLSNMTYQKNDHRQSAFFDPMDPHHPSDSAQDPSKL